MAIRPIYLNLSGGMKAINFRDFATSPLTYSGINLFMSADYLKTGSRKETEFGISYSRGNSTSEGVTSIYSSSIQTGTLYYSMLYGINRINSEKWNFKAGGELNVTGNYRYNPSLNNNGLGYEVIGNVMGSVKITRDFSRKVEKEKKFLFISYTAKPKTKLLSFRLNVGVINSDYRNGYGYIGQSAVNNQPGLEKRYVYSIFSGYRLGSDLAYTIALKNNNAIRFSYLWDAYETGGPYEHYQMASHVLKFTLLFRLN